MDSNVTTDTTDQTGTAPDTASSAEGHENARDRGIVVGYDGSFPSQLALDWAIETARERGRPLTIVHGMNLAGTPGFSAMDLAHAEPVYERTAQEIVAEGAERAKKSLEVNQIETLYWLGSPAGQIIEASRSADLVVVGSRGRGRIRSGLLGSTSYAVAAHSHCPVVIVRAAAGGDTDDLENLPRPNRPDAAHPVLVGSDDSTPSERAVDAAAEAAAATGARLRIVRVAEDLHVNTSTVIEAGAGAQGVEDVDTTLAGVGESLNTVAERVRAAHPSLEVTTEAVLGEPGATLSELGKDAGLVVVGSRGRGGFAGMLLGSVSHRVIHDAVCPVMVVR
ncbi:MAG TPA: universal stress protein [Intrasporangium sp.]|nr:universal stress protein [Intrasporangium sp.]